MDCFWIDAEYFMIFILGYNLEYWFNGWVMLKMFLDCAEIGTGIGLIIFTEKDLLFWLVYFNLI